jgi:hypothetical protein
VQPGQFYTRAILKLKQNGLRQKTSISFNHMQSTHMKKVFLPLLFASVILVFSCGSNNDKEVRRMPEKDTAATSLPSASSGIVQTTPATSDKESAAIAELCTCVNSFLNDMSPQVRAVIVKAGKSSTPLQTLATEMQQIKGIEEQERLIREFDRFESDTQLQRCSESIKKKYNLDENDPASREKVLKAAGEKKECEVVYALMKIGMEQEKSARAIRK